MSGNKSAVATQKRAKAIAPDIVGFDLTSVPTEIRSRIATQIRRVHDSLRRTAFEIIEIGHALIDIRDTIEEGSFESLIREEFRMDPRVARRFMQTARYVDEHLTGNQARLLNHLSPTVLYQLAQGDVTVEIVQSVLEKKTDGQQVMPADIRKAMAEMQERLDGIGGELAEAVGQLSDAKAKLAETTERADRSELAAARYRETADRVSRSLTNAQEDINQMSQEQGRLQDEINGLRDRLANPATKEVEKEVAPAGFRSIQEAIAAKEKDLRDITNKRSKLEDEMGIAQRRLAEIQGQLASSEASFSTLTAFRADIQALCAKFPAAFVIASANDDRRVTVECTQIADHLRKLADQIETKIPPKTRKS
ncbi:MAG: hypothetical protein WAO76_16225 [Georgfuchsia sp.]